MENQSRLGPPLFPDIWSLMSDCIPSHAQTVICFESRKTALLILKVLKEQGEKNEEGPPERAATTPWTTACSPRGSGRGEMSVGSG